MTSSNPHQRSFAPDATVYSGSAKKKVLLVDNHPLLVRNLAAFLQGEPDLEVCGTADDLASAMQLINQRQPDIVVLDLSLEQSSGLDLLKVIHSSWPTLPVLVSSMYDESVYGPIALRAGARGYVAKPEAVAKILPAIRTVLAGEKLAPDANRNSPADQRKTKASCTT